MRPVRQPLRLVGRGRVVRALYMSGSYAPASLAFDETVLDGDLDGRAMPEAPDDYVAWWRERFAAWCNGDAHVFVFRDGRTLLGWRNGELEAFVGQSFMLYSRPPADFCPLSDEDVSSALAPAAAA